MPTLLSKSKLVAFRLCPKRLWLAVNRPSLREVSDATARNFDAGHQVGAVARRVYDARERGTLVDIDDLGFAGALRRSRALLGAKSPQPVFEAGFAAAGVLAFADVMLPATRPRSGMPPERSTSWRMIEVKSTTTLKDYHRDDVAIQTFAALQSGIELSAVAVAHLNKGSVYPGDRNYGGLFCEVDLTAEVMTRQAEVAEWVDDAHRFSQRQREPRQAMGAQCAEPFECAYRAHCEARTPPVKAAKYPVIWLPQVRTTALKERIAALSDAIVEGAPEDEVRPLIVATALEHHLVSKYTSLVAVDVTPIAPAGTVSQRTAIPGLLPAGLDPAGFVGGLPQTATPAPLLLLVGIALAALAWLLRRRRAPPSDRLVSLVARAELARRVC